MQKFIFLFYFIILAIQVFTQDIRYESRELDNVSLANELFSLGRYFEAIDYFEKALLENKKLKSNAELLDRLAYCYRFNRNYESAATLYKQVLEMDNGKYPFSGFYLGLMLKAGEDYKAAKFQLSDFLQSYTGTNNDFKVEAKLHMTICDSLIANTFQKSVTIVSPLESVINGSISAKRAIMKGDTLWFLASEASKVNEKINLDEAKARYAEYYISRPYISKWENNVFTKPEIVSLQLSNERSLADFSVNNYNDYFFFTLPEKNKEKEELKIYRGRYLNGKVGEAELLSEPINKKKANSRDPYFFQLGGRNYLFYSSDKASAGNYDIYICDVTEWDKISNDMLLSSAINTKGDERAPFFDVSDSTLYFSSNGHLGMGELDLFSSKTNDFKKYHKPRNLGKPINSGADDYFYHHHRINSNTYQAYISSNRISEIQAGDTYCDRLYTFTFDKKISVKSQPVITKKKLKLEVYDAEDGSVLKPFNVKVFRGIIADPAFIADSLKDELTLLADSLYQIMVSKKDYDTSERSIKPVLADSLLVLKFYLNKKKKEIVPENIVIVKESEIKKPEADRTPKANCEVNDLPVIYYRFNESEIDKSERIKLNQLAVKLLNCPDIYLVVASHTDNIDTKKYNIILSERRTKAVIEYLNDKGIKKERIKGQWFGEEKPTNSSVQASSKAQAKNRRTEFYVVDNPALITEGQMVEGDEEFKLTETGRDMGIVIDEESFIVILNKYGSKTYPELKFRIQIGAFKYNAKLERDRVKRYALLKARVDADIFEEQHENMKKLTLGPVITLQQAQELKLKIRTNGIPKAFIVPYFEGKRIKITDAIELLAK